MLQRQSQLFLPTLREDPGDAEAVSHKLLVRAGLIRQVGAGLWTYLPAGWRVHERVVQIVREEMDAIGGQEMSMPVITPSELWEKTGRIRIPEVFKLTDRAERPFVLALTPTDAVASTCLAGRMNAALTAPSNGSRHATPKVARTPMRSASTPPR